MTLKTSGSLTTRDVAEQLFGNANSSVSTADASVQRFVKKQSDITLPSDYHGKSWGQQMNDLAPDAYNQGNSTNMKPHLMDRRSDGGSGTVQQYTNVRLDGSKSWYGGCYVNNYVSNKTPRDCGFNGYFYASGQKSTLSCTVEIDATWQYGPGGMITSLYILGFSDGYLSGNRIELGSNRVTNTSRRQLYSTPQFNAGYRHMVFVMSQWQDTNGTSNSYFWDGKVH